MPLRTGQSTGSSPIRLIDVHELIAREALKLLRDGIANGWAKTKGVDAIHLATARREGVQEFVTTEKAMNKWAAVLGFKVCAPHHEPRIDQLPLLPPPEGKQP